MEKIMEEVRIGELLKRKDYEALEQMLSDAAEGDAQTVALSCLLKIYRTETENGLADTVMDYAAEPTQLVEHFVRVKLLLRRLEFDLPKEEQEELYEYCRENRVSVYFLSSILCNNIFHREKVCGRLIALYREKEGETSETADYFFRLAHSLEEKAEHADSEDKGADERTKS